MKRLYGAFFTYKIRKTNITKTWTGNTLSNKFQGRTFEFRMYPLVAGLHSELLVIWLSVLCRTRRLSTGCTVRWHWSARQWRSRGPSGTPTSRIANASLYRPQNTSLTNHWSRSVRCVRLNQHFIPLWWGHSLLCHVTLRNSLPALTTVSQTKVMQVQPHG